MRGKKTVIKGRKKGKKGKGKREGEEGRGKRRMCAVGIFNCFRLCKHDV